MDNIFKNKMLIFSIILAFGLSFSYCGKKKTGLLLLPDLIQGEGGPKISPDSPKTVAEEIPTTQNSPTIEVVDNYGLTVTDNNSGDSGKGVIYLGPPEEDKGNGENNNTDSNATDSSKDSSDKTPAAPAQETPQIDDKSDDFAQDPIEMVVIDDKILPAKEPPQSYNKSDLTSEEQIEETATTEEEQSEESIEEDDSKVISPIEEEIPSEENKNCKAKLVRIDTTQGRWYNTKEELLPHPIKKDKVIKAFGIHTYWAYQKLLVTINSNCDGSKYRLIVVAKNIHGPLPDWYHFFNVKVVNESTGESLGTMLIRASDKHYYRGRLDIKLAKGENVLNLLWTNDAWEPNKYDANIQIKRIFVKAIPNKQPKQILTRIGSNFCDSNGRWFIGTNPPSAYTYWQGQTVSYCLRTKQAGKYEILIQGGNAKNGLPLMPEYKEFKLLVAANGISNYLTIKAEQGKYLTGTTTLDLPEGDVVLNVTWLNDMYQPPLYDANIEITRVKIKRIGNADSPISAFLLQNPNITYNILIPSTVFVIGILGMIYWFRKERTA